MGIPHITKYMGVFDWQFQTYQIPKMVDFAEMETQFPIKEKLLQNSRFQIYQREDEVSSRKTRLEKSGVRQQRVELQIPVATRAKSPRFQSSGNEIKNLSKVSQIFCL